MTLSTIRKLGSTGAALTWFAVALTGCNGSVSRVDAASSASLSAAASQTAAKTDEPLLHIDKVSLERLSEQPAQKYPWGEIRWLMSGTLDPQSAQTFGVVTIYAGQKNALHLHPNCEELLYVLSGSGESIVADKTVQLRPGDLVRIPAHVLHQATVTSKEPLVAVISYSSPDRQVINYGTNKE